LNPSSRFPGETRGKKENMKTEKRHKLKITICQQLF